MKKIYLLILCIVGTILANATDYYVDAVKGVNGNLCLSPSQAFKSIPTSAALPVAGDTVLS